jgi:hypothetical protein
LVEDMRRLFHTIHRRDEYASEDTFRQALDRVANNICWDAFMESPGRSIRVPATRAVTERWVLR